MPPDTPEPAGPCYRFTVAPRFSLPQGFVERLERNGGVRSEAGLLQPIADWRPLEPTETASLVTRLSGRDAVLPPTHLGLLQVPDRLRAAWWAEAEGEGVEAAGGNRFEGVFSKVVEFLRFKRLPFPERVTLRMAISAPGLASTRVDSAGGLQGLGLGDTAESAESKGGQPVARINFGDEAAFVVLLELPPVALAARLGLAGDAAPFMLSPASLVRRYFEVFPEQPLLRVRLEPGEGLWLSPFGVVHDGWTKGKLDLDVMLLVGCEATSLGHAASAGMDETCVPDGPQLR
jgi:hypothetical protein